MDTPFVPVASVFDALGVQPTYVLENGDTFLVYKLGYGGKIATGNADGSGQVWRANLRDASGKIVGISGALDTAAFNAYVAANAPTIPASEAMGDLPKPIKLSADDAAAVAGGTAHPATVAASPAEVTHVVVEASAWQKVKAKLADLGHDIEKLF